MIVIEFVARYFHVLFGLVWVGLLYYFNFVQTEYFKEAEAQAKADAVSKLVPRALWWFRWAAMATFLTGLALLHFVGAAKGANPALYVGAAAGIFMFLNVWLIIWPNQKIVIGLKEGDGAAAAAKAGLASRTNTLFSGPMLFGMLASKHLPLDASTNGMWAAIALLVLLEINGVVGKLGPLKSVVGVVHMALVLAGAVWALLVFV